MAPVAALATTRPRADPMASTPGLEGPAAPRHAHQTENSDDEERRGEPRCLFDRKRWANRNTDLQLTPRPRARRPQQCCACAGESPFQRTVAEHIDHRWQATRELGNRAYCRLREPNGQNPRPSGSSRWGPTLSGRRLPRHVAGPPCAIQSRRSMYCGLPCFQRGELDLLEIRCSVGASPAWERTRSSSGCPRE